MENNYIFKNKTKISKRSGTLYIFTNLLTSGLMEDNWILISTSAFNLLQYFVLVDSIKKGKLHMYSWKREKHLTAFSNVCGHCYYIQTRQEVTVSFNVTSETISMNFSYLEYEIFSYSLKATGLSYTLNGFYQCVWFCSIMLWPFGKYCFTELFRSSKCHDTKF